MTIIVLSWMRVSVLHEVPVGSTHKQHGGSRGHWASDSSIILVV